MTNTPSDRVAGETFEDLIAAFSSVFEQSVLYPDGSMRLRARLTPDLSYPLRRALMRVEAELLLADAAALSATADETRTPEQRRFDAFVSLGEQLGKAIPPTNP